MSTPRQDKDERAARVKELLAQRRIAHDANQLLIDVMDRWGGTRQFADALYSEFMAANPGSLIRQNILEMIQKLVVNNTNHQHTRVEDVTVFDDDEIQRRIDSSVARVVGFVDERQEVENGPATRRP